MSLTGMGALMAAGLAITDATMARRASRAIVMRRVMRVRVV